MSHFQQTVDKSDTLPKFGEIKSFIRIILYMHYAIVHIELNVKCYFDDFEKTLEIIITD